jgi:hypothetical protein
MATFVVRVAAVIFAALGNGMETVPKVLMPEPSSDKIIAAKHKGVEFSFVFRAAQPY